jgi:hypothetical protein
MRPLNASQPPHGVRPRLAWLALVLTLGGCHDPASGDPPPPSSSSEPTASVTAASSSRAGPPEDGVARFRNVEGKLGVMHAEGVKATLERNGWSNVLAKQQGDARFTVRAQKAGHVLSLQWRAFDNDAEKEAALREARFVRDQLAAAEANYLVTVVVKKDGTFTPNVAERILKLTLR